ncbi:DUF6692 family protein [Phenylobacterium sp.]|uniref:DUF6692 family protein n=1 Tax=Phenylobacterium sp. TaxID=1871053 RepID=UPI003001FB9A
MVSTFSFRGAGFAVISCLALAGCGDARPDDKVVGNPPPPVAELAPAGTALQGANVPTLDPVTVDEAEIAKVIGPGPWCAFHYTRSGKPVLAFQAERGAGVVKLNGKLIRLASAPAAGGVQLSAETLSLQISSGETAPDADLAEAEMVFNLRQGEGLTVGYGGYYGCAPASEGSP